jgi:hypothetical protein
MAARHGGLAAAKEPPLMAKKPTSKVKAQRDAGKSRHRPRNRKTYGIDELPKR